MPRTKALPFDIRNITLGFEIEGFFNRDNSPENLTGEYHHDGSVHGEDSDTNCSCDEVDHVCEDSTDGCDCEIHHTCSEDNTPEFFDHVRSHNEYASGIFKSETLFLGELAKFEHEVNHVFNATCGLHVHIRQPSNRQLFALGSHAFLQKLHAEALTWCDCQRRRLEGNTYYFSLPKSDTEMLIKAKYQFMRFHPSGTCEFRFLCPCAHKVENVQKLLAAVKAQLQNPTTLDHETPVSSPLPTKYQTEAKRVRGSRHVDSVEPRHVKTSKRLSLLRWKSTEVVQGDNRRHFCEIARTTRTFKHTETIYNPNR